MMKTNRITLLHRTTYDPATTRKKTRFSLPPDLQAKACARVAQFSLLMTGIVLVVFLISRPVWQDFTPQSAIFIVRIMQAGIFVLSLALFLVARSHRYRHATILNLGLLYEFVFCLIVSIMYNWFTGQSYGLFAAINLSTLVIAVYPMIVPSPPLKTLITALASAATAPFGVYVVASFELVKTHPADYLGVSIYPGVCVALAVFGSRIIYGLNRQVVQARDLGSYQLKKLLGKGGMGEVWRAVHRLLARPAAVKIINPSFLHHDEAENDTILLRFEREARATASLQSPHTVALYDYGQTDENTFYYAMELLDGLDLESFVTRFGPIHPERTIYLLKQACMSLAEAHESGLVHRDIKPANIMLCRYGREFDFIKVLDFGLVAWHTDRLKEDQKLTVDGLAMGTPAYMPPEIIQGLQADQRTDLYALGCVAYWMLTGVTVFEKDNPMATVVSHVKDHPVSPSMRSEFQIQKELEDFILACLEKRPEKRPRDAEECLAHLDGIPLSDPWTRQKAAAWWKTHLPQSTRKHPHR